MDKQTKNKDKKMTKTITQKVEFNDAAASELYAMFLNTKHHSNIRSGMPADISEKEGTKWSINNGHIYGKILELVKDRLIVLSWRSVNSIPEDVDEIVVLNFIQNGKDALVELTHANLPERRYETVLKSWEERYWIPWKNYLSTSKTLKMQGKDFHTTIIVNASAEEAMKKISQINLWWVKNFSGKPEKLNDKFHVPMGETFVDFQITELVPNKKMVWKVTDCYLPWLRDKKEWNGTKVVFEISGKENATQIDFTHIGLVPGIECYNVCEEGWNGHITNSLVKFINEGVGHPKQF